MEDPRLHENFMRYDSHFIAMALQDFAGVDTKVSGQGMEKYLTVSLGKFIIFKDSYQFIRSSLATLPKKLQKTGLE